MRAAKANWLGNLKDGKGTLSTQSGVLDNTSFSFKTRFEDGEKGTNPEELLAAALASCFTMAVVSILSKKGLHGILLETLATLTMDKLTITDIHLSVKGTVPDISEGEFISITKDAEKNCIIAKALRVTITSEASFVNGEGVKYNSMG